MKNSKFLKIILSVCLVLCIGPLAGCSANQTNKITVNQFPNTVAANSKVCQEYSDIASTMSNDIINEFMEVTKIPRPTGYTEKISAYLNNKIAGYGLTPQIDEPSNTIYFDIPATNKTECQQIPTIIIQAHADMVTTASDDNKDFNFFTTPLDIDYDKEANVIHSKDYKTNMGGDDGHGIALIFALTKNRDSFDHGPIRFLFTQEEETTCDGAKKLTPSVINSEYLINADGYQIGNILCSSGGIVSGTLQKDFEKASVDSSDKLLSINWNGLAGGHTGNDATKNRIHASKAIVDYFKMLDSENITYKIAKIESGNMHNAYPSSFTIKFYLNENSIDKAKELVKKEYDEYKNTKSDESDFSFDVKTENSGPSALSATDSKKLMQDVGSLPEGVIEQGVVDINVPTTSSAYCIFSIDNNHLNMSFSFRSSNNAKLDEFETVITQFAQNNQMQWAIKMKMYGWEYKEDNPLAQTLLDSTKNVANFEGAKTAIHGGLEASCFLEKHPSLNMVSIGLDLANEHMLDETIYTNTIDVYAASVLYTLQHLPQQ